MDSLAVKTPSNVTAPVSPSNPVPVALTAAADGVTPVDAGTLSITAGGTAQAVFAANAVRRHFVFQNISDTAMWIDYGKDAVADSPSIYVAAGAMLEPFVAPTTSITVFCATTGKKFSAKES